MQQGMESFEATEKCTPGLNFFGSTHRANRRRTIALDQRTVLLHLSATFLRSGSKRCRTIIRRSGRTALYWVQTPMNRLDVVDPEIKSRGAFSLGINRRGYPPDKALARKAIPTDIRSLCRAYTGEAIRHLAAIMRQREYSPAARVQAASVLLDRGWGKPPQAHTGEDDKDIRVTIRQIVERRDED